MHIPKRYLIPLLPFTIFFIAMNSVMTESAIACGGLFCDNTQPVNQAAERILFAPDEAEDLMHMHVQITYQGPPDAFSWLLPVPPGTSFGLSRPALFTALDNFYTPMFRLNRISAEYCPRDRDSGSGNRLFANAESSPIADEDAHGDACMDMLQGCQK